MTTRTVACAPASKSAGTSAVITAVCPWWISYPHTDCRSSPVRQGCAQPHVRRSRLAASSRVLRGSKPSPGSQPPSSSPRGSAISAPSICKPPQIPTTAPRPSCWHWLAKSRTQAKMQAASNVDVRLGWREDLTSQGLLAHTFKSAAPSRWCDDSVSVWAPNVLETAAARLPRCQTLSPGRAAHWPRPMVCGWP